MLPPLPPYARHSARRAPWYDHHALTVLCPLRAKLTRRVLGVGFADLVFLDGFRRVLMENPDKVPPQ